VCGDVQKCELERVSLVMSFKNLKNNLQWVFLDEIIKLAFNGRFYKKKKKKKKKKPKTGG
jgi:hypothetical protein